MGVSRRTILQAAAVAGLTRNAGAAEAIKIGIPVALTGPLGGIGAQMRRACDFWAKQVNAKGGIIGRPVELVVEDTAANPATTVRKVQEMVERNGIRLITCVVASNEALAVVPKLAEWDTIFISGDNGDGRLTGESLVPNFFRPNTSGPMGTRAVALWLRDSPLKNFYGIGMDYAWGHNSMEVFEAEAKRAGKTFLGAV
ncbi:MAG: branched-chain amino acid transport system substrate-binding protein, partial [Acetobacteraceae bacterium]|nr:branched-chain amino acid transport system substrate-binding protein [Acetobacteraceae bacterium]